MKLDKELDKIVNENVDNENVCIYKKRISELEIRLQKYALHIIKTIEDSN